MSRAADDNVGMTLGSAGLQSSGATGEGGRTRAAMLAGDEEPLRRRGAPARRYSLCSRSIIIAPRLDHRWPSLPSLLAHHPASLPGSPEPSLVLSDPHH